MSNTTNPLETQAVTETSIKEVVLWFDLQRLQERYVTVIDSDRLEEWPELFTDDGIYEIIPKENADLGLSIGIMHCFGRAMMRDRIVSLRKANVFEPHSYRHMTSGLEFKQVDADSIDMQSHYVVVQTLTDGESRVLSSRPIFRQDSPHRARLALSAQARGLRHIARPDAASYTGLITTDLSTR